MSMLRWMWLVFLIYFKQFFGCFVNYICYKERYIAKLRFFLLEKDLKLRMSGLVLGF